MTSSASEIFCVGRHVTGSTIIPLSERFTLSTSAACASIVRFLWMTPRPPFCAIAIARRDSVTVSIAAERIGMFSPISAREARLQVGLARGGPRSGRGGGGRRRTSGRAGCPGHSPCGFIPQRRTTGPRRRRSGSRRRSRRSPRGISCTSSRSRRGRGRSGRPSGPRLHGGDARSRLPPSGRRRPVTEVLLLLAALLELGAARREAPEPRRRRVARSVDVLPAERLALDGRLRRPRSGRGTGGSAPRCASFIASKSWKDSFLYSTSGSRWP